MIGTQFKKQFTDNEAWVLSYREECFDAIGLKASLKVPLYNGSLECELRKYQMFSGRYNEVRAEGVEIKSEEDRKQMAEKRRFKEKRAVKQRLDESDEEFEQRFERIKEERRQHREMRPRFEGDDERPRRFDRRDDRGDRPRRFGRDDKPRGFDRRENGGDRTAGDYRRNRRDDREARRGGRDFKKGGRDFKRGGGKRYED
jgi:putative N6-adenine-specific DNA methylase